MEKSPNINSEGNKKKGSSFLRNLFKTALVGGAAMVAIESVGQELTKEQKADIAENALNNPGGFFETQDGSLGFTGESKVESGGQYETISVEIFAGDLKTTSLSKYVDVQLPGTDKDNLKKQIKEKGSDAIGGEGDHEKIVVRGMDMNVSSQDMAMLAYDHLRTLKKTPEQALEILKGHNLGAADLIINSLMQLHKKYTSFEDKQKLEHEMKEIRDANANLNSNLDKTFN